MTQTPIHDELRVARAWAAFARHDATLAPPPPLDRRIRTAATQRAIPTPAITRPAFGRAWLAVAAGVAACLMAIVATTRWPRPATPVGAPPIAAAAPVPTAAANAPLATAVAPSPAGIVPRPNPRRLAARRTAAVAAPTDSAAAGVDGDGPLQVIRVRVEASALDAFGIQVAGPASAGLVDVDLVVGVDGWPREVRRIRPVPATALPE